MLSFAIQVYANGTKGGSQSGTNSAATASKPKDDKAEAQLAGIEWSDVSMFVPFFSCR